jgi:type I restriction enzyme, S subunit
MTEQRRIVAKIESLFAQVDTIERAVAIAQKRADKIDQSILARAFRGGL